MASSEPSPPWLRPWILRGANPTRTNPSRAIPKPHGHRGDLARNRRRPRPHRRSSRASSTNVRGPPCLSPWRPRGPTRSGRIRNRVAIGAKYLPRRFRRPQPHRRSNPARSPLRNGCSYCLLRPRSLPRSGLASSPRGRAVRNVLPQVMGKRNQSKTRSMTGAEVAAEGALLGTQA